MIYSLIISYKVIMAFKISIKKSWLIFNNILLIFSIIMLFSSLLLMNDLNLEVQLLVIFLPVLLLFSYCILTFNFLKSVKLEKENILIDFGPFMIHKKYYYRDMKDIRYAKKEDYITRQHPAMGVTEKTVAITFKDEEILFISVEKVSEFYGMVLKKIFGDQLQIQFDTNK